MGILLSVKLPPAELECFERAAIDLLRSCGAEINSIKTGDDHTMIRAYKHEPAVACGPSLPAEPPAPVETVGPETEPEAKADDAVPSLTVDPIVPPLSGSVSLKDLAFNPIPFLVNPALESSELSVHDLIVEDGQAQFSYCGMTFKYPISDVAQPSIRVLAELAGDRVPVVLKLINSPSADECSVIFGSDSAETITQILQRV